MESPESMELDPVTAATAPNPYPYYARLIAERPFYFDPHVGMWVASSAEAVEAVLASPYVGVRPANEPVPRTLTGSSVGDTFGKLVRMTDGPVHAKIKAVIASAFERTDWSALAATSERCAGTLMCTVEADRPASILSFAFGLPALVTATMLGFDPGEALRAVALTARFAGAMLPDAPPAAVTLGSSAVDALRALLRAPGPTQSLFATLEDRGYVAGVRADDLVANAAGFFFQGHDATAGLIGNSVIAASMQTASARTALRDYPTHAERFTREVARHDAPVQNTRRFATRDHVIMGATVSAGDCILVLLAAANRDPSANVEPERMDPTRVDAQTYTFGFGAHACPGMRFATTLAGAGLSSLLDAGFRWQALGLTDYLPRTSARIPTFSVAARVS